MREPKVRDSLSWGKQKSQNVSSRDAGLISAAVSSLNKFSDDGSFASEFLRQQSENTKGDSVNTKVQSELVVPTSEKPNEDCVSTKDAVSANQLAAKAFQLQMKGKHEEAQKLLVGQVFSLYKLHSLILFCVGTPSMEYRCCMRRLGI